MNTEHIDIGLARYSDWAFTSSVVVLVAALLLLAVELAYARSRAVTERELVAAGTVAPDSATLSWEAAPGVVGLTAIPLTQFEDYVRDGKITWIP